MHQNVIIGMIRLHEVNFLIKEVYIRKQIHSSVCLESTSHLLCPHPDKEWLEAIVLIDTLLLLETAAIEWMLDTCMMYTPYVFVHDIFRDSTTPNIASYKAQ